MFVSVISQLTRANNPALPVELAKVPGVANVISLMGQPNSPLPANATAQQLKSKGENAIEVEFQTSIDFNDDGKTYPVEWMSQQPFQKGTYTILMYADGYTMGKGSIYLK